MNPALPRTLQRVLAATVLLASAIGCGIPIGESAPLTFVAPLEGTWTLRTDSDVELRVTIPGGQDLFAGEFQFSAEIIDTGTNDSTTYNGMATGTTFELRDPGTNALLLTGEMVLESASSLSLSDGSVYDKAFQPDLTTGTWQDVNHPTRLYKFDAQDSIGETASGCATDSDPSRSEVEGELTAVYDGEDVLEFRVSNGGILTVRAAGFVYGASAMRVKRVSGYLHLQRVDRNDTCP